MKKKILFIINPISGTTNKSNVPEKINDWLDHDLYAPEICESQYVGHASEMASQAVADGFDVVVAVGGDGTINEVARTLVHTRTALGIIPLGSGNGLARHLLIPIDIKKSVDIINACQVKDLDYGVIDGHPFFCTCGMGFDAFVSMKFAEDGRRGPITYIQKVLEEGLNYKPETYELQDDEGRETHKAFLISCANASQYGNNAYIAPHASMSDGLMDIVIMEPFDLLDAPQIAIDMFSKTLDKNSKIKSFRTRHLCIHRSSPGVIHYDGDPVMAGSDIDIRIEAKGIPIIVNPSGDRAMRFPSAAQTTAAELFNEISDLREQIAQRTRRGLELARMIQKDIERRLTGL